MRLHKRKARVTGAVLGSAAFSVLTAPAVLAESGRLGGFALSTLVIVAIGAIIATAIRRALYSRFTNGDREISFIGTAGVSLLEALLFLLAVQVAVEFSPWREPVQLLAVGTVSAFLVSLVPNALLLWPVRAGMGRVVLSTVVFPLSFWGLTAALFVPLYFYFMGL